ncbi:hypothetical protein PsYK624_172450 [Phanerochaete sordida]|uniref:Uncharacterized protein n=1 Tax=Phanerochaete sordida TaxID=48140 RepID=A0A9P3GS89_9APHY|nr:hypothetical protein PsYK624_172450 [Phanerochaete sordida]
MLFGPEVVSQPGFFRLLFVHAFWITRTNLHRANRVARCYTRILVPLRARRSCPVRPGAKEDAVRKSSGHERNIPPSECLEVGARPDDQHQHTLERARHQLGMASRRSSNTRNMLRQDLRYYRRTGRCVCAMLWYAPN